MPLFYSRLRLITRVILLGCITQQTQIDTTKVFKFTLYNLTFRGPCIVIYSYNKSQRDALISQSYFWNRTLHVSERFSVHHQESSTVYTATGICHTGYADCLLANSQHNLYELLCVQCKTPDDGQKTFPKHVEFYSKNKFEKLVHLVCFIIRITLYKFIRHCLCIYGMYISYKAHCYINGRMKEDVSKWGSGAK